MLPPDNVYFLELQTKTGWGRVLSRFADWINPSPDWKTLDVGCGPGLFAALFAERGCQAVGIDLDPEMLKRPIHSSLVAADGHRLPFPADQFDLVTASNLLFFLPDPSKILIEMARVLHHDGMLAVLNPSELMNNRSAAKLAEQYNLTGLARETLLNWATRAMDHHRWSVQDLTQLLGIAGLRLIDTETTMGPGLARFVKAIK